MKTQEILIAYPKSDEQVNAFKVLMGALKIKFEVAKEDNYNPVFVNKILKSKEQIKNGKVTRVAKEDFKDFLGL